MGRTVFFRCSPFDKLLMPTPAIRPSIKMTEPVYDTAPATAKSSDHRQNRGARVERPAVKGPAFQPEVDGSGVLESQELS